MEKPLNTFFQSPSPVLESHSFEPDGEKIEKSIIMPPDVKLVALLFLDAFDDIK